MERGYVIKSLLYGLTGYREDEFRRLYNNWEKRWKETIDRRTNGKNGRSFFTHKRLRTLVNSINFYMPYLFTFQHDGCDDMPNTNNKIEGIFTDLKKNLNNHSGMTIENRKRFINGFFLALLCYASVCAAKIIISFFAFHIVDNFSPHFVLYA